MTRDEALAEAKEAFVRINKECAGIDTTDLADRHVVSILADRFQAIDAAAEARGRVAEREACAKECEAVAADYDARERLSLAAAAASCGDRIRARGRADDAATVG